MSNNIPFQAAQKVWKSLGVERLVAERIRGSRMFQECYHEGRIPPEVALQTIASTPLGSVKGETSIYTYSMGILSSSPLMTGPCYEYDAEPVNLCATFDDLSDQLKKAAHRLEGKLVHILHADLRFNLHQRSAIKVFASDYEPYPGEPTFMLAGQPGDIDTPWPALTRRPITCPTADFMEMLKDKLRSMQLEGQWNKVEEVGQPELRFIQHGDGMIPVEPYVWMAATTGATQEPNPAWEAAPYVFTALASPLIGWEYQVPDKEGFEHLGVQTTMTQEATGDNRFLDKAVIHFRIMRALRPIHPDAVVGMISRRWSKRWE